MFSGLPPYLQARDSAPRRSAGHGPGRTAPWPVSRRAGSTPIGWIAGVRTTGFRNLADADLELPAAGCLVVGPNGHGKTSLIEALLYAEILRSFRGAPDRELVRFGEAGFHVAVTLGSGAASGGTRAQPTPRGGREGGERKVAVGFDARTGRKKVTVDGAEPERLADAIGVVRGVVLSPGDVSLVAGGPRERRHWLDVVLALTVRGYVETLATYRRALRHRSRATPGEMPAWERMLAEAGAGIVAARKAFVDRRQDTFRSRLAAMGEKGEPALAYASRTGGTVAELLEALERARERDAARGRTGVGPHRDDLRLTLDGRELRRFGSAGQQRTAALALRLLEAAALEEAAGEAVTLCLDDAFAELDETRSARLGAVIEKLAEAGGQVVAAVPKESDVPDVIASLPRRRVKDGRVQ